VANDIDINIVARDFASRIIDEVSRSLRRAGDDADKSGNKFKDFGSKAVAMGRAVASAGAMVAALGSLAGPLTSSLVGAGKALAALGRAGVSLLPLAAFLPSLVGAGLLVKTTFTAMGPAIVKALQPIGDAFMKVNAKVGDLAAKHVPELAKSFVKVNMPNIAAAMDRIAVATNGVILGVGKWINSAAGQELIRWLTAAVATQFERLAPKIEAAAIALLQLAGRAGAVAITGLGKVIGEIVDAFTRWARGTSVQDINKALDDLAGYGRKIKSVFEALRDVGKWMVDNQATVKKFSDALAGLGIVLGAITGNWVAVAISSFSLMTNNLNTTRTAVTAVKDWWSTTWSAVSNDPSVKAIWQLLKDIAFTIKGDLTSAWNVLWPQLQKLGKFAQDAWVQIGPLVVGFFKDPNVIAGIKQIAYVIAGLVLAFAAMAIGSTIAIAAITAVLAGFTTWMLGVWTKTIGAAVATVVQLFGEMLIGMGRMTSVIPGMGSVGAAMVRAGQSAENTAAKIRNLGAAISALQSKTITVTTVINNVVNTITQSSSGATISGGGTVQHAFARGGPVPGMASNFDTEHAMLARGEFVVNSRATRRNLSLLNRINSGGSAAAAGSARGSQSSTSTHTVVVNIHNAVVGNEDAIQRVVTDAVRQATGRGYGTAFA